MRIPQWFDRHGNLHQTPQGRQAQLETNRGAPTKEVSIWPETKPQVLVQGSLSVLLRHQLQAHSIRSLLVHLD